MYVLVPVCCECGKPFDGTGYPVVRGAANEWICGECAAKKEKEEQNADSH